MHKIYYSQRCLAICSPEERDGLSREFVILPEGTGAGRAASLLVDENAPVLQALVCDDTSMEYGRLNAEFKQVNAAGGLVRDPDGYFLMMFRNGVWDLPKGHQEKDEPIEATAEREIAEETAIKGLRRGKLICITDHCYFRNGIWHIKHTWWFDFTSRSRQCPRPQTEEGIASVVWTSPDDVRGKLENSYPSIREVFEEAMKLFGR